MLAFGELLHNVTVGRLGFYHLFFLCLSLPHNAYARFFEELPFYLRFVMAMWFSLAALLPLSTIPKGIRSTKS